MVDFTLLEIDVDVESVTADAKAYAPFARSVGGEGSDDETTGSGATVEVESAGGGRMKAGLVAALVGLVFLVVAGLLLRRYVVEGDDEGGEEVETAPVTIE